MRILILISMLFSFNCFAQNSSTLFSKESIQLGQNFLNQLNQTDQGSSGFLSVLTNDPVFKLAENFYNMSDSHINEFISLASNAEREIGIILKQGEKGVLNKNKLNQVTQKYQNMFKQKGLDLSQIDANYINQLSNSSKNMILNIYNNIAYTPVSENDFQNFLDTYTQVLQAQGQ